MTIRIYQAIPLHLHDIVLLDEPAHHHLTRVLRASCYDPVTIFNGQGGEYLGIITQIDKKYARVELQQYSPHTAESSLNICLAQGIARGEKMDYIIQKAVELGVNQIMPLFTERCNVKLDTERSAKRVQHWQSIAINACEQSGRNNIPQIVSPQPLSLWLSNIKADYRFVLSPWVENRLKKYPIPHTAQVALLIGPEGGLSEQEIQHAMTQGCQPLNLGPRVLRTETAALAAITALQFGFGDMG